MRATLRDLRVLVRNEGFTWVGMAHGKHAKLRLLNPHGAEVLIVTSTTPSDVRTLHNLRALLRRKARLRSREGDEAGNIEVVEPTMRPASLNLNSY